MQRTGGHVEYCRCRGLEIKKSSYGADQRCDKLDSPQSESSGSPVTSYAIGGGDPCAERMPQKELEDDGQGR